LNCFVVVVVVEMKDSDMNLVDYKSYYYSEPHYYYCYCSFIEKKVKKKNELGRTRTYNLLIRSQTRYPLRYKPLVRNVMTFKNLNQSTSSQRLF
jgi:hypothetical protein